MSAFSSFCVPEVEGCGPLRDGDGGLKDLPSIALIGVLDLSRSLPGAGAAPLQPPCLQHIIANHASTDICCIDADSTLSLIDATQLRCTTTVVGAHSSPITSSSFLHQNNQILATCSQDGAIKLWDFREQSRAKTVTAAAEATVQIAPAGSREADMWALAVRGDDKVFAASFKNSIKGYDIRAVCSGASGSSASCAGEARPRSQRRGKRLLWDLQVHGDLVTALQFHPVYPHLLVSGGEDSLICICDTTATSGLGDTDATPVACFSQERSVKGLSLLGPGASCVCIRSAMEDVGLWQVEGLHRYCSGSSGEEVSVQRRAEWLSVRSHPAIREGESSGYVVDTFYDEVAGRLYILSGWSYFKILHHTGFLLELDVKAWSYHWWPHLCQLCGCVRIHAGSVSGRLLLLHANLDGVSPAAIFRQHAPPLGSPTHTSFGTAAEGCGHTGVVR